MINQSILFSEQEYTGVERTDRPVYPVFGSIYKGMQKRFWIPENIPMGEDKVKFQRLPKEVQELFTMNLAWQIFADSAQSVNLLHLAQQTNNIELKRCIILQAAEESNHSGSYQYVISSMYDNPTQMLNEMEAKPAIIERQLASTSTGLLSDTIHPAIRMLALEGLSFTTSFLATLAINHNYNGALSGCKDQILKIAADESGHIVIWSNVLKILLEQDLVESSNIKSTFQKVISSELEWISKLNLIYELPELQVERVRVLLQIKANQLLRGIGLDSIYSVEESSLHNWYKRAVNINSQQVELQASNGLAYVAGEMKDDWD